MQRRKFIAGMGSLAAAGAATVGTGAFTSVQADRSIDVEVASDTNAFLAIRSSGTANANQYVDDSGDTVSLDFTGDDDSTTNIGSGVNDDAVTVFDDLLEIQNQGTQTVIVGHRQDFQPQMGALYHEDYEDGDVTQVGESSEYPNYTSTDNEGITNLDTASVQNLPVLGPGDTLDSIGFFVTPDGGNSPGTWLDGTITFTAGADPSDIGL